MVTVSSTQCLDGRGEQVKVSLCARFWVCSSAKLVLVWVMKHEWGLVVILDVQSVLTFLPSPFLAPSWQVAFGRTILVSCFLYPLSKLRWPVLLFPFYSSELPESVLSLLGWFWSAGRLCRCHCHARSCRSEPCSASGFRHISHTGCMKSSAYQNRWAASSGCCKAQNIASKVRNSVMVFARTSPQ